VRIADKKTLFYANAGNNPHSAELLPDGNIVSAASTGNVMTIFNVDTAQALHTGYKKTYYLKEGHNVVWDKKRQLLWATSGDTLKAFTYNRNCEKPELKVTENILLPGPEAHDLFPVFGKDELWFTNVAGFYKFDLRTKTFTKYASTDQKNIKSVSSGPLGYPVITMRPKEQWWTDEVTDNMGKSLYLLKGLKIYKARWFVDNQFSYPEKHVFDLCN
jgi:streptogramin lyase